MSALKILVIGDGLAGSIAALKAVELGAEVTLLSREENASSWAQGGIVYRASSGDPHLLKKDIFKAGSNLNNEATIDLILNEGPKLVEEWFQKKFPIPFDVEDGKLALGLEGAHSARRILHISDQTGAALLKPLREAVQKETRIKACHGNLVELLMSERHAARTHRYERPRCFGAYAMIEGQVQALTADATLLACGGYSGLYRHSSGPQSNFGGGIAVAGRAGARLLDLEFVQFHPTTLFVEGKPRRLLTEALRGEGARLLNFEGKHFVDELAPRDVVARAIHSEIARSERPYVYLDMREVPHLKEKFHHVDQLLRENNLNPARDLIPVVPAAHYTMGGVWTDLHGQTTVPGLWAAGEVACTGLHGANRLASMSLLEALVFADRAAASIAQENFRQSLSARAWTPGTEAVDSVLVQQDWQLLRQTLWNYVGIVRSLDRLERASKILNELQSEVEEFYRQSILSAELLALRQGVSVGKLTVEAALRRRESLGSHFLADQ